MTESITDDQYIRYGELTNNFENPLYDAEYNKSMANKEQFWADKADELVWTKRFTRVLDEKDKYMQRWYPDGEMNICYNCVDRHVDEGRGDLEALAYDSAYTGVQSTYTYKQLQVEVGKLASLLKTKFGIGAGDRVLIYMPMVPSAAFAMLACARIGAIHSVVFGGFAAKELANRIDDCLPKLIVTCSAGLEPKKVIKYAPIVDEALSMTTKLKDAAKLPRLIYQRPEKDGIHGDPTVSDYYYDYQQTMDETDWPIAPCESLPSTHELYILYTSGTTGEPKGIVRDCGGTAVGLNYCMKNVFDLQQGGVHFAASDIGWVVGHSFIVYGPLLRCARAIFFEGKPVVPDAGVIWRVCEEYKVTSLYMAPTGVRVIKKEDYDGVLVKKYDISSVRTFCLVGERCDPDTIHWIHKHLPKVLINDTWWQTETGWPICANLLNVADFKTVFPTLPGSVTRSVPGYEVKIFDEGNQAVEANVLGKVVIKLPLPPAFMLTLWGNDGAFIDKYLTETPGYYTTGDAGIIDARGYLHIMTRMDDVINTAGHRISTGRLEEVINDHESVVESAVVGYDQEVRGECPLAFVILRGTGGCAAFSQGERDALAKEINLKVRADVGAFCRLEGVLFLDQLPKTRSGKILRGTIKKIVNHQPYKFPATIDDPSSLDLIVEKRDEFLAATQGPHKAEEQKASGSSGATADVAGSVLAQNQPAASTGETLTAE